MNRSTFFAIPVLALAALLAACGSNVKLDDVPVENRTGAAVSTPSGTSTTAATGVAPVEIMSSNSGAAGPTGVGKIIYFDKSVKYLLDDIDNTSNTWDGKMISRRWKMTEKGLECIDCEGLDRDDDEDYNSHEKHARTKDKIIINGEGIEVNGNETEINIDEDGIRIKTPEKNSELKSENKEKKIEEKIRSDESKRQETILKKELETEQLKREEEVKAKENRN